MMQDDVLIIHGCCIRLPDDLHNPMVVRHSSGNNIRFSVSDHIIDIISIDYTSTDALAVMLTAVSRYACLIYADGITCCSDIPHDITSIVDASGILDRSYV